MSSYDWADGTRTLLSDILVEAVVVIPVGATEQHGPHLPLTTDTHHLLDRAAIARMKPNAVLSPRPVPCPIGFVVKNGSRAFSRISGAIPTPVSAIDKRT